MGKWDTLLVLFVLVTVHATASARDVPKGGGGEEEILGVHASAPHAGVGDKKHFLFGGVGGFAGVGGFVGGVGGIGKFGGVGGMAIKAKTF